MGRTKRKSGGDGDGDEREEASDSDSSAGNDNNGDLHRGRKSSKNRKRSSSSHHHKSERSGERKKRSIDGDAASGSSSCSTTSSHGDSYDRSSSKARHKRGGRKRDKKEKKKKRKKHRKKETSSRSQSEELLLERNYALADALCSLLQNYTALSGDLPVMLIRLCGGTTFDFSQMPDSGAAQCLDDVFSCLGPFGVVRDEDSAAWKWNNPAAGSAPGLGSSTAGTELTLVRVVRALLEQIGLTIPAIDHFETSVSAQSASVKPPAAVVAHGHTHTIEQQKYREEQRVLRQATDLLKQFGQADMAKELAGLCSMILEGESVALSGLSNEQLRTALESLFDTCGLEVCEMEASSDEDDDEEQQEDANHHSEGTGYGLPETNDEGSKALLQSVLNVCRTTVETNSMPIMKGPMLPPKDYDTSAAVAAHDGKLHESLSSDDEEDGEGPLPAGLAKAKSFAESNELVKAKAARRARELECVKHGVDFDASIDGNAREEWMLVPGKFDFLSAVKSGQPIRSRQFDGKSKAGVSEKAVDPKIRAEIRAIHQAHEEARGPSLMEQHRAMKRQEAEEKLKSSDSSSWKWSRDNDLDAGRRVDKDALNMILGGAGKDLKTKFH